MKTPTAVIRAYVRRIERGDIVLEDIEDDTTRKDVEAYIKAQK